MGLAAIAVTIVTLKIKASFSRTVRLTYMNRNLTWAEHFNGRFIDQMTMDPFSGEYWPFMVLYAFPQLPELDVHWKYHWNNSFELFSGQFKAKKMYLNTGSRIRMNLEFCGSAGVQVLVIQYDGYITNLSDPDVQKDVKLKIEFPGHGNSCQTVDNITYYCAESAAYQFVVTPWNMTA